MWPGGGKGYREGAEFPSGEWEKLWPLAAGEGKGGMIGDLGKKRGQNKKANYGKGYSGGEKRKKENCFFYMGKDDMKEGDRPKTLDKGVSMGFRNRENLLKNVLEKSDEKSGELTKKVTFSKGKNNANLSHKKKEFFLRGHRGGKNRARKTRTLGKRRDKPEEGR